MSIQKCFRPIKCSDMYDIHISTRGVRLRQNKYGRSGWDICLFGWEDVYKCLPTGFDLSLNSGTKSSRRIVLNTFANPFNLIDICSSIWIPQRINLACARLPVSVREDERVIVGVLCNTSNKFYKCVGCIYLFKLNIKKRNVLQGIHFYICSL